jgi:tetratricopeptide (TPR) repeat protein
MYTDKKRWSRLAGALVACACCSVAIAQASRPLVPSGFVLDDAASKAISAEWLTEDERHALRVFHGVWDERDLVAPDLRGAAALNAWRLDDPALDDAEASVELRADAKLRSGEAAAAIELVKDQTSIRAIRIRAEALEMLGDREAASAAVKAAVDQLLRTRTDDPAELTEGVRAMVIRARLEGQPARDFQTMLDLLARAHNELDRLYWPALLAEADLLFEKDAHREAVDALHQTLSLNPRCAEAWYLLGRVALQRFEFDQAATASRALRRLNADHPLATVLDAESRLVQDDPEQALEMLDPLTKRWPQMRLPLAYIAASQALLYDNAAMQAALDRYDALSPGSAVPHFTTGRHLSFNRQYPAAAKVLEEAIRRQPHWPAPQIELGLMELQSGRDDRALAVLERIVKLDPYNKRAANSLFLLQDLASYAQEESEHFILRYKPGVDEVMAEMMLDRLEQIHAIVAGRFQYEPPQKTVIELMPDHERFSVRITGMPFVHTVAACTGPVISLEVPREGPPAKHLGMFDWPRVIQHEYTHTITLAQTSNRIPHWLTEGAAVSMEPAPRDYSTCMMLADAWRKGTLFNLDDIKWAFVRPRKPDDRGKAYAQGHWIVQYMNERYGESALVRLMARYDAGEREQQAIPNALGISREQFFREFVEWAGTQVASWGLGATPTLEELTDELREADPDMAMVMTASQQARLDAIAQRLAEQVGAPGSPATREERQLKASQWPDVVRPPVEVSDDTLMHWLGKYPDHPDLVEMQIRRLIDESEEPDPSNIPLLERYANLRPVDPYPHRKLAQIYLASEARAKAIPHLEELDIREDKTTVFAVELAELYRRSGQLDKALEKITRAIFMNPYDAPNRELAATIAIESGQWPIARQHIRALTILEPGRPQHQKRLEAIDRKLLETNN